MICPATRTLCNDVTCARDGCQGWDVEVQAVTVIQTTIRTHRRGGGNAGKRAELEALTAEASLVIAK